MIVSSFRIEAMTVLKAKCIHKHTDRGKSHDCMPDGERRTAAVSIHRAGSPAGEVRVLNLAEGERIFSRLT
jgi:hypothetical protein